MPNRPCLRPLCSKAAQKGGYCPEHTVVREPFRRDRSLTPTKRGYGERWRRMRKMVLERDPMCKVCRVKPSTQADHITPKSQGGRDAMENLRGICEPCHRAKSSREGAEGLKRRRSNP